jgi:hydrogenase small subunit
MTAETEEAVVHILWINAGLSCDGDSVALTAATQPSIEEIVLGALPGLPKIAVHWPLIDFECGKGADTFIDWFYKAERGELEPFVLVVEGSIPNEAIKEEGYWCGFGNNPETGQPRTTSEWLDILAPKATAVLAVGTCATYGGIHAMAGNPTDTVRRGVRTRNRRHLDARRAAGARADPRHRGGRRPGVRWDGQPYLASAERAAARLG